MSATGPPPPSDPTANGLLLAYAARKGVQVYDGVTATASPTEGAGLRAEAAIHAGEPVLTLPLTSTLSLAGELTGLPPPLVELVSGIEQPALALAVLLCFSLSTADWSASWARENEGSWRLVEDGEIWEHLTAVLGDLLFRHALAEGAARKVYDGKLAPFVAANFNSDTNNLAPAPVSWERFVWALSMVESRAARVELFGQSRLVLMPLVDLLNHRADPTCSLGFEPDAHGTGQLVVRTKRDVAAGEALTICYGQKENSELVAGYGFALASNPWERTTLAVPLATGGTDPMLAMQKMAMLPRGTARPSPDGASEGIFSFGWASDATAAAAVARGEGGQAVDVSEPGCPVPAVAAKTVELGAEAWMVLRVASAPGAAEIFAAMAGAAGPDPATPAGWRLLLKACEAKLLTLPAVDRSNSTTAGADGAVVVAAAAAAQRELLEAAATAARAALAC